MTLFVTAVFLGLILSTMLVVKRDKHKCPGCGNSTKDDKMSDGVYCGKCVWDVK